MNFEMSFDRLLRWALLAGAVADLAFGAAELLAWRWLLNLLRVPLPPNPAFVKLAALLSIGVGLMILAAWRDPQRYRANVDVAVLLRFSSAALLAWLVCAGQLPLHILWLAAGEGLLGVLHLVYALSLRSADSKE